VPSPATREPPTITGDFSEVQYTCRYICLSRNNQTDRETFLERGISDSPSIDGKEVRTGPPPSYEKVKGLIEKRVKKL